MSVLCQRGEVSSKQFNGIIITELGPYLENHEELRGRHQITYYLVNNIDIPPVTKAYNMAKTNPLDSEKKATAAKVSSGQKKRKKGKKGGARCVHGKTQNGYLCKKCPGKGICEHGRQRSSCKECGGSQICEHNRQRNTCKECRGGKYKYKYASTVVNARSARNVEGHQYASTIVNTEGARNVEGHQYASTVVDAISAKIVEGHQYASTVVDAISARILVGVKYASTVVNTVNAKNDAKE